MNRLVTIWLLALAVKLVLAALVPLSADEAYYWFWSRHLQWSYLDHPPFVAWLFFLGEPFYEIGHAARWPAVILGHLTFLVWLKILEPILDDRQRLWWLCLALVSPFIGVGSLIVTPDIPLLFFWALSLLALLRATETGNPAWYAVLGCFLGLGFCSKYPIVLFVPTALLWLVFGRRMAAIRWACVPLTVAAGLVFSFPVLYWNYQNEFVSFRFQLTHGLGAESWNPQWTIEYVLSQIGIVFPTILYLALRAWPPRKADFLVYFAWFPVLFFLWSSTQAHVEANWPSVAYAPFIALAVINARKETLLKWTLGIWIFTIAIAASDLAFDWLPIPKKEKLHEHARYDAFVPLAEADAPLYVESHQMAAQLSYKSGRDVYKLRGLRRVDFFDFLDGSQPGAESIRLLMSSKRKFPVELLESGYGIVSGRPVAGGKFVLFELKKGGI